MIVIAITGFVSLLFFGFAIALIAKAGSKPPRGIRSESRRSPGEYAFQQQRAVMRRQGYMLMMAGVMTLGVCLTLGVFTALAPVN